MTTATPVKAGLSAQARPFPGGGGGAGPGTASIDIVKILKKYAWLLVAAAFVGGVLGTAAHVVLMRLNPIYRPTVSFQVLAPTESIEQMQMGNPDQDEQERFMATQVAIMKSDAVIQRVVTDPRFTANGGDLAQMFVEKGALNSADAAEWFYDNLRSRVVPNTSMMEMSLGWKDPADVTNVLGLVRETYMTTVREYSQAQQGPQRTQLENQIRELEDKINDKQAAREAILRNQDVDSLDQRYSAANQALVSIIANLQSVRSSIEAMSSQLKTLEAELNSPVGPTYSDELVAAVESEPLILTIHQSIAGIKASLASMKLQGYGPEHRDMMRTETILESWQARLEDERERLLRKRFAAIVDSLRNALTTMGAQRTQFENEHEALVTRLIDLNRTFVQVNDLDMEIEALIRYQTELESSLNNLRSVATLQTSTRVVLAQQERIPDKPVFPNILVMIPAGVVLLVGLTGGIVFLRELFDQRVKGPSDVTMIPRTRLLGMVPDAGEDSATPAGEMATAFTVAPQGAVAEAFRQIRSPLLKKLDLTGHKTVMVMAGMPGSGASSVVSNLAQACASADRRVLVIDANFRRPSQHKIHGLPESPGLADILAGETSLEAATQTGNVSGLALLAAGSPKSRVVERLSTEAFSELLAAAAAEYDVVLIDVPPAIVAGDGVSVANRCDASILVAKAYSEKRGLVSRIRNELSETRSEFIGVIINGARASAGGYLKGNIRASQEYLKQSA